MTITHEDFLRLLPRAINNLPFSMDGNKIEIEDGQKFIVITLEQEVVRTIAALRLPVTSLMLELHGYSPEEMDLFLTRFDLAYQKGGG